MRRPVSVIAVVVLLTLGAWWLLRPRTPKGQEPLISLTANNFGNFQKRFDDAAGDTRIVALLSPT